MKDQKIFLWALIASIFISFQTFGQFTLKSEIRTRAEFRNGYKSLPTAGKLPAYFINQRTRLGFDYKSEKLNMNITIQDARVWGDETAYSSTSISGDLASLDLKEGWAEWLFNNKFSIKTGRQEWIYDDERLLSKRDWPTMGMSYDGILMKFKNEKMQADFGLSLNNKDENTFGNDYRYYKTSYSLDTLTNKITTQNTEISGKMKSLDFIYLRRNFTEKFYLSLLGIASGWQQTGSGDTLINFKYTTGSYLNYEKDRLSFQASFFYQFGKHITGEKVNAYLASFQGNYKTKTITAGAGVDYISGHDASNNSSDYKSSYHMFDLLYGNRHRNYGHIDMFSNMENATKNGGLVDIYLKLKFTLKEKHEFGLDGHSFSLQNTIRDPKYTGTDFKALEKALGNELDLYYSFKVSKDVNIKAGYSFFLATESMEKLQGLNPGESTFPSWGFVIVTFKPEIFTNKK